MKTASASAEAIIDRLNETAEAIERTARRAGRGGSRVYEQATAEAEAVFAREWAALRRDLADLASNADLAAMPEVRRLIEQMKHSVAAASASVGEAAQDVRRRTVEQASSVDAMVHDAPWKTAGLAALAGVAVGLMIGRR